MLGFAPLASIPLASTFNLGAIIETSPGRPMRFTAIPDRFEFAAEYQPTSFNAVSMNFTFKGIPE